MTPNETRTFRLAEAFALVDERLLAEAYPGEDAASVTAVKKRRIVHYRPQILISAAALLLVFALTAAILPRILRTNTPTLDFPQSEVLGEGFVLDSLDKLNYCVARVALASTADRTEAYRSRVLLASSDGSVPPSPSKDDLDVSYYDLDPDEIFRVTKTVYFEIELKSEFGYLASMLGTGRTEVVITENSLETMITFRHGDRYFSCLLNGMTNDGGERTVEFTTHKYIEGYAIVKNFEQMNYSFSVTQRRNTVMDFTCRYSGSVSQNPMYAPDIASVIPGSTYVSDREVAFTLRSAQDFFGGTEASPETTTTPEPLPPETLTAIYTGHAHEFIFLDDGSFLYCNAFGDRTPLRIGVYQLVENDTHHGLFLKFTLQDGSVYATAFAPFIDESRAEFNYEGEFFRRARIDPVESEVAP